MLQAQLLSSLKGRIISWDCNYVFEPRTIQVDLTDEDFRGVYRPDIPFENANVILLDAEGVRLRSYHVLRSTELVINTEKLPKGLIFLLHIENEKIVCARQLILKG